MTIKKGMEVSVSLYNMHHDPNYFPEPEEFIPGKLLILNFSYFIFFFLISKNLNSFKREMA